MTRRHLRALLACALPLLFAVAACDEQLETANTCPLLCPGQQLDVLDAVIDPAIVLDTTLGDFPYIGSEAPLVLASRGDTLDLRVIIRFDTLVRDFTPVGGVLQTIVHVDSATINFQLRKTEIPLPAAFTIEAYDVGDTTLADSLPDLLMPLFTAPRLLGSLAFTSAGFVDSAQVKIPVDSARLRAIIGDPLSVFRVGLRIVSTESVELLVTTSDDAVNGPFLNFRPSADSGTASIALQPSSRTPVFPPFLSSSFVDYQLIADAPDIRVAGRFSVGGLPGSRSYLRFDLPRWLTDSVFVLKARLELTQDPIRGLDETDSVNVRVHVAIGGNVLTDLHRAATILAPTGLFITDSISRMSADSGIVAIEINGAVRQWRTFGGVHPFPTALVLRSDFEGSSPLGLRFFGLGAAPSLRPRLVVSYVPNVTYGRP